MPIKSETLLLIMGKFSLMSDIRSSLRKISNLGITYSE